MGNHLHLLVEAGENGITRPMHRLLCGFAKAYNKREDRRGHVFDARFKSILVEGCLYYLGLIAYIHLNPIRAGVLAGLDELVEYPWTGHSEIMGEVERGILTFGRLTEELNTDIGTLRASYKCLLENRLHNDAPEFESGTYCIGPAGLMEYATGVMSSRASPILGSRSFALKMYSRYRGTARRTLRCRESQHRTLEDLLSSFSTESGIPVSTLRSGARDRRLVRVRRKLTTRMSELGMSQSDIASFLGISASTVHRILRGRDSCCRPSEFE